MNRLLTGSIRRRDWLASSSLGFGALALQDLLARTTSAAEASQLPPALL